MSKGTHKNTRKISRTISKSVVRSLKTIQRHGSSIFTQNFKQCESRVFIVNFERFFLQTG